MTLLHLRQLGMFRAKITDLTSAHLAVQLQSTYLLFLVAIRICDFGRLGTQRLHCRQFLMEVVLQNFNIIGATK